MSFVLFDDQLRGRVRVYQNAREVVRAHRPEEVARELDYLERARRSGRHLAGWLSYDLGAATEPALAHTRAATDMPLLEVGIFDRVSERLPEDMLLPDAVVDLALTPEWSEADYGARFERLQDYIAAGDVYQVNLAFAMRGQTDFTARELYRNLRGRQAGAYGGLAQLGETEIISLSPELFVSIRGGDATLRPMKGTLAPGDDPDELATAKSRAENLMIVDLLRNDLSRIARAGSVKVPELFTVEHYPTVTQMTSTVTGQVGDPPLRDIVRALFPCGSVTGAPKIRAMEIIAELEGTPRGPYCGSLFWMDPKGRSEFNVMIRTLIKRGRKVSYSVGSGVVSDSEAASEYGECLLKARVLSPPTPGLIETFRLGPRGYVRLERHLNRLERSARELGVPFDFPALMERLSEVEAEDAPQRIRIELKDGGAEILVTPLIAKREPVRVVAASRPLTPEVQPTAHKVSTRAFYDAELRRALAEGADEAILMNPRGEVCEGTFTSVFVEKDGELLTPALACGLLPGMLREHLLDAGKAREAVLFWDDLLGADALYVGNSLRGLMLAEIV